MKILSEKIKFYTGVKASGSYTWTAVSDVTSIPAMGAQPEKVETTSLGKESRQYIQGLKDFGDLQFGFVFDCGDTASATTQFETLKALEGANHYFRVSFPGMAVPSGGTAPVLTEDEGLQFYFKGEPTVAMGAAEVGARIDYSMSIALASDIVMDENDLD